jgi:hypothetical protein
MKKAIFDLGRQGKITVSLRVQLYYLQYVYLLEYMLRTEQSHHDRYISFFRSNLSITCSEIQES